MNLIIVTIKLALINPGLKLKQLSLRISNKA